MNFERNKGVLVTLDAGRSKTAFHVTETWVCVVAWDSALDTSGANIGRYFRAPNSEDFQVMEDYEYEFLSSILNKDDEELEKLTGSFLKGYSAEKTLLFAFRFVGDYKENEPKNNWKLCSGPRKYYFADLYGQDLKFSNGKFLHLPDSRIVPNSDFQLHLRGRG